MTDKELSNKKISFYIALAYTILATVYSYWAMANLVVDGIFYYLFFPATIFPSLILLTERESGFMILICQAITLLLIWGIFWLFLHSFRDENK
ncbi:MAG: hypothetical protein V4572_09920 [Bacteroidota bacterium]